MRFALALAAVALFAPARALAQDVDHIGSTSRDSVYWYGDYELLEDRSGVVKSPRPSTSDEALRHLYDANLLELRQLSFALAHAEDPDLRDYIEELMLEHTLNNEEVIEMARDRGIELGHGPAERNVRLAISPLRHLDGVAFDSTFTDRTIRSHEELHASLRDMMVRVDDRDIVDFAESTADDVENHQEDGVDLAGDFGLDRNAYVDELPG